MAVLPQLGGLAEAQTRALLGRDSGAALLSAAGNYGYPQLYNNNCAGGVVSGGAQSELTCNGGGVAFPSRKRGREAAGLTEQFVSSSSALLPVPGMLKTEPILSYPDVAMASTSGRQAVASAADAVVAELCRHGAEMDALVRAECERMRAGLERARKRQRQALVGAAERRLREREAELCAARRRAAELEERLRQAAAESQAWCGVARANEAVAAGLRAALDQVLLRGGGGAEGCGESGDPAADDAQSCCFVGAGNKWACKACGAGDATVLLLPCRHLCLCKSCEPKLDACPVCLAVKNASIHIANS